MSQFKFAACEWSFPCWGELAVRMAGQAGFDGMQLGDGGGSMHAYPLLDKRVQEHYLQAGEENHIEFPQIHLYTLGHQCYYRSRLDTLEGQTCLESIKNGVIAASQMGIPSVIIDGMRMNNAAKKQRVFDVACTGWRGIRHQDRHGNRHVPGGPFPFPGCLGRQADPVL